MQIARSADADLFISMHADAGTDASLHGATVYTLSDEGSDRAARKAIDSGCGPADPAVREAAETVAIVLSLVAPYTAEEMWSRLGHEPTVARAGWPTAVDELLEEIRELIIDWVERNKTVPVKPNNNWRLLP